MNHLGEKCHEIVFLPETCPSGESVPDINYWVIGDGCCEVEDDEERDEPVNSETLSDGTKLEQWTYRRDRIDEDGALISRYILTTVGRVVMNHTIIDAVAAT